MTGRPAARRQPRLSRRTLLRSGAALAAGAGAVRLLDGSGARAVRLASSAATLRLPDSVPDPGRPAGTPHPAMPFDHVVVLMMENHSFDNFLGDLSRTRRDVVGQFSPGVDFVNFDSDGTAVAPWHLTSTCEADDVDQSWDCTHRSMFWGPGPSAEPDTSYRAPYDPAAFDWSRPLSQVPLAKPGMRGFVLANGGPQTMGYWTAAELPFTHSMAQAFTVANRWFCSAPCQTYPNRRFLMAGTAFGDIATDMSTIIGGVPPTIATPPANGTIFDRLSGHGVTWRNYFTDLPATGIIPTIIEKYPANVVPVQQFFADCAAGTLPAVSFVDPEFGALGEVGAPLASLPVVQSLPGVGDAGGFIQTLSGSQEAPANVAYGEEFVAQAVTAVLHSPAWARTLLIWTFDEHGGYADHVPPPAAIPPDGILPDLSAGDFAGAYDMYGPRVPAVVVSPYARAGGVSNTLYDHTSVLATIEAKWNLPALTYRDANASTVLDCLDTTRPPRLDAPALAAPGPALPAGLRCTGRGDSTGTASPALP